jgi:hypothetical protein
MAAKTVTTYVESLFEGPQMGEELGRLFSERKTGKLSINLVCGGIASIIWTEKNAKVSNGNGELRNNLTPRL